MISRPSGFLSKFYQQSKEQIQFLHKIFQRPEKREFKEDNIVLHNP